MTRTAVFLFPAVVGGGLGDIDEVLVAGGYLAADGFPVYFYRPRARPPLRDVAGPWRWPPGLRRVTALPKADRALTVAPSWGVSAGPPSPGRLGRPGPWSEEAREVEERYGPNATLHLSLEEFARLYTSENENRERYREGGWARHRIERTRSTAEWKREVSTVRTAMRRFRVFDRPNVLHLYGTFGPSHAFAKEFPEAVQTGPLWPRNRPSPLRGSSQRDSGPLRWVWYASPSSSEALVPGILRGFARARTQAHVVVRSPRPIRLPNSRWVHWHLAPAELPSRWNRRFASADLRIVTGSRTLLEALRLGAPWLYFNGVTGVGPHRRRHRPEKIDNLLRVWPEGPHAEELRRDLRDVARGRRVDAVVAAFARDPGRFFALYRRPPESSLPAPYDDQGQLLVALARRWTTRGEDAPTLVQSVRRGLLDLTPRGA